MNAEHFASIAPGQPVPLTDLPHLEVQSLRAGIKTAIDSGCRLALLAGRRLSPDCVQILALLSDHRQGQLRVALSETAGPWPSLAAEVPQADGFEREMAEQTALEIAGHPHLSPLRRPLAAATTEHLYKVAGEEVHEVAVGPVHAGVIEPGHFRFQCHGETVLNLDIVHGYQHRGVEQALLEGPSIRSPFLMETVVGDTTIGHMTAYCRNVESLTATAVPAKGEALRAAALELERIANHTGDLGAMSGDIGYLPAAAYLGRLRGEILNITAEICGNRFGRGLVRPGGTGFDLDTTTATALSARLKSVIEEVRSVSDLLWESPSVRARFEGAGTLDVATVRRLGMTGPAARAAGLRVDARVDFPLGFYQVAQIPISTGDTGDVLARALVRWLEIQRSATFVTETLANLPTGLPARPLGTRLRPSTLVVACCEGWRGEIWHAALTNDEGRFSFYKIVDPSFHNWAGLALAMRGGTISDFPLYNKSFNLSYCGFDL